MNLIAELHFGRRVTSKVHVHVLGDTSKIDGLFNSFNCICSESK